MQDWERFPLSPAVGRAVPMTLNTNIPSLACSQASGLGVLQSLIPPFIPPALHGEAGNRKLLFLSRTPAGCGMLARLPPLLL